MRGNGASRNAAPAHDASEKGLTHLQGGSPGDTECRGLLHRQVVGHNEEQVRVRLGVLCESSSVGVERTVGDTGDLVADLSLRLLVRTNLDDLSREVDTDDRLLRGEELDVLPVGRVLGSAGASSGLDVRRLCGASSRWLRDSEWEVCALQRKSATHLGGVVDLDQNLVVVKLGHFDLLNRSLLSLLVSSYPLYQKATPLQHPR